MLGEVIMRDKINFGFSLWELPCCFCRSLEFLHSLTSRSVQNDVGYIKMEELNELICKEYAERGAKLGTSDISDTGERRKLRIELQERCGIPSIWALNIINGIHIKDYISIIEKRKKDKEKEASEKQRQEALKKQRDKSDYLEWVASQEELEQMTQLMLEEERRQ